MTNSILDDFKNAWNKPNNATAQLIIINVVVFLFLGVLSVFSTIGGAQGFFTAIYSQFSIPPLFEDFLFRPWTLITYGFAHSLGDIFHILFNMLIFYWFSKLILEYLGNQKIISIYVMGVLAGGLAYLFVYNVIPFYNESAPNISGMVGASAAVYAITVAAATLNPNYTFYLLFLGPVKIKYIAGFYIVISFLGSVGGNAGGNIAHLGGAFIGFLYVKQLQSGNDIGAWVIRFLDFVQSFFNKSSNIKVTHRSEKAKTVKTRPTRKSKAPATKNGGEASQEQIDAILDKISQSGYESLTKDEKQQLFNASKK